jgi:toxin FitB
VRFLLDTNVVSELRKRERADPGVRRFANATPPEQACTSVLVLAEIRLGIESKRRNDPGQAELMDRWFVQLRTSMGARVLPVDEVIADRWARLSVPNKLPLIDGLLAATALVRGLTLVTRDVAGVARTGVQVLNPFEA